MIYSVFCVPEAEAIRHNRLAVFGETKSAAVLIGIAKLINIEIGLIVKADPVRIRHFSAHVEKRVDIVQLIARRFKPNAHTAVAYAAV